MVSHPNADTLNITKVFDYQVITKKDGFKEGDLVVYVPIDAVVPDTDEWYFLCPLDSAGAPRFPMGQVPEKYRVIEAKKLRGIFSQGILSPLPSDFADDTWNVGDDLTTIMGITKYEPPAPLTTGGDNEAPPQGWVIPVYTDIEGMRRYPHIIQEGEQVVITEKIHGANARYVHDGERLWVGSHTGIKKEDTKSVWWQVAKSLDLENKLSAFPFLVFFGEVYGQVQDLKYGVNVGAKFRAFDVYDAKAQRYLDHHTAIDHAIAAGIPWVPTYYTGPWSAELNGWCEGKTLVFDSPEQHVKHVVADHVREGFVVKPTKERWNEEIGRVILKRHGEGYLLRKKK